MSVALIAYTLLIACCVGCLAGYHGKLACEGATTNEELRGKFDARGNPYDLGCGGNCSAFWKGGTSRIYPDQGQYDAEALSQAEPNVFVIKQHKPKSDEAIDRQNERSNSL